MTEREAARWLLERDNFLILTHIRPDGDTLGCAAALCAALRKRGKTVWAARNLHFSDFAHFGQPV